MSTQFVLSIEHHNAHEKCTISRRLLVEICPMLLKIHGDNLKRFMELLEPLLLNVIQMYTNKDGL